MNHFLDDQALKRLRTAGGLPEFSGTRYVLLEFLARGGMGTVYAAQDQTLNRRVAIKVLDSSDANGELEGRLLREARVLAGLEHPGIVPVHDAGTLADGRVFYVMKFVEGSRVDELLAGNLSLPERLRLFLRICETMSFAHSSGILHRDLKPANVMVGAFGEVLARYENYVDLDPVVKDKWGIPALRFHYKFGDNEHRMAEDMKETAQEMFEAAGFEIVHVNSRVLTEGWSIHELGTARMGSDPKTSVLNQFQQSHDVKNLFVVDGSAFVNASCQNPTWTIMSLCWRSCDYLADQFGKGNL